ncbi:hypothetical protein R83H12_00737 [Fibrobacteria bacterium R8-3-H12]
MLQIHYIRGSYARFVLFWGIGLALVALVACSNDSGSGNGPDIPPGGSPSGGSSSSVGIVDNEYPFTSDGETLVPSPGLSTLNPENAISIKYKNGSAPEISNTFSEVSVNATGEDVVVIIPNASEKEEYSFILSGTASNGSLKFYGDVRKALYLNSVSITNSKGPAINIQGGKRVLVHLVNGTQNFLTDGPNYDIPTGEQAKGAFFSEGKLNFEGSGSLEVKGKYNHAIVADNDFEVSNGKIVVSEAVNDGIHANNMIEISGGVLIITSTGDAIQSEKEPVTNALAQVKISGGKIKAQTTGIKSHGIASEGPILIDSSAIIQINVSGNGSKGIRSRSWVEFGGNAKTSIKTTGTKHTDPADPDDESNSAGIKSAMELTINGGEQTIKTTGIGAKGINVVDGNAFIKAGKIDIDADDDGLRVHGKLEIKGGTGSIKSKKKKAINADSWDNNKGSITTQDGVS